MNRVLIMGGGLQGLSVACSLHRNSHQVSAFTKDKVLLKSRYVQVGFDGDPLNKELLFKILDSNNFDVIIPMSDNIAIFISRLKSEIPLSLSLSVKQIR